MKFNFFDKTFKCKHLDIKRTNWCRLSYWEMQKRVGKQYPVKSDSINISAISLEDGLCLKSLFHSNQATKEINNTRTQIGLGVTLFRDQNKSVWIYNRSSHAIFTKPVTYESLNAYLNDSPVEVAGKVFPGHLVKVYDYQAVCRFKTYLQSDTHTNNTNNRLKLTDVLKSDSFSFSFVKGFGGYPYSRSEIMQCPCWIEVILEL